MKKDTNPRGTTEAIGTCFQGTKGKWSMHTVAYEDCSARGSPFPAAKSFGKPSALPDKGRQAMQLIAQSVAEVAATALAPHLHPPAPAAHPMVEPYSAGTDLHTMAGHARALAAAVPACVGGASHGHCIAAQAAASAAGANPVATPAHPPPPPPPPETAHDASPRPLLAAQPAGACMHDGPAAHSPPGAAAPRELVPPAVNSHTPVATQQRARVDTPEPSPRAIPFAQSASLLADATPAAARRVSGRASSAPAALASVSAGVTPAPPPPPPPEDLGRPASAGVLRPPLRGTLGPATKRPLCNIAHSTVTEAADGTLPGRASERALQGAAGAPSLERPPAESLSPATTESAPRRRRVTPATPSPLLGALASPPATGTPTQPQWKLSASPLQDRLTAAAAAEQDAQPQLGLHVGARLQPLLPPCALTPASSNTPSPATEQHLDPLQPTEPPSADLSPGMQPTEQQAAEQESPDLQPTELQQPDIQPTELQLMSSQDTEIEAAGVLPSPVQPTELQRVESQPALVLPTSSPGAAPVPHAQPKEPRLTEQSHAPQPEAHLARPSPPPTARRAHGRTLPTSLQATQSAPQLPQHAAPGTAQPARAAPGSPDAGPRRRQTCDRAVQTTPPPALRRTATPRLTAASLEPPTPAAARFRDGRRRRAIAPAFDAVPAKRARSTAHNTALRAAALCRSAGAPARSSPQTLPPLAPALPHTLQPHQRVQRSRGESAGRPGGMGGGGIAAPPSEQSPAIQGSPDPRSKAAAMAARGRRSTSVQGPCPFVKDAAMHATSAGGAGRPRRALVPAGRASTPVGAHTDVRAGGEGRQLACFPGRDVSVMPIRAALLRGQPPHAAS